MQIKADVAFFHLLNRQEDRKKHSVLLMQKQEFLHTIERL